MLAPASPHPWRTAALDHWWPRGLQPARRAYNPAARAYGRAKRGTTVYLITALVDGSIRSDNGTVALRADNG